MAVDVVRSLVPGSITHLQPVVSLDFGVPFFAAGKCQSSPKFVFEGECKAPRLTKASKSESSVEHDSETWQRGPKKCLF